MYANLLRPWKKVANIVTTFSCEYLSIRTDIVRTFFSRVIPLASSSFIDVSLYDKTKFNNRSTTNNSDAEKEEEEEKPKHFVNKRIDLCNDK